MTKARWGICSFRLAFTWPSLYSQLAVSVWRATVRAQVLAPEAPSMGLSQLAGTGVSQEQHQPSTWTTSATCTVSAGRAQAASEATENAGSLFQKLDMRPPPKRPMLGA